MTIVGNHWYPVHGLGLPLLAAPFFAAAGRPGVVVMLALLTVAELRILWSFLRRVGMGSRATGFATIIAAFTLPLAAHFLVEPWVGLTGVLFDQQSGLFIASPVYVLAIPGFLLLWRQKRSLAVICLLVFASLYLPAGAFGMWYGGLSSPARLLTPIFLVQPNSQEYA